MRIASLLFSLVFLAGIGIGRAGEKKPVSAKDFIAGAEKVEVFLKPSKIRNLDPARTDAATAVFKTKADIKAFCGGIDLKSKGPCNCDHFKMIRFSKGKTVLVASFCSHCLDIEPNGQIKSENFNMPKALWARILKLHKKKGQ